MIGSVSASDVMDVSNDPSNDESLSDSIYQVSDESIKNKLSNEAISSEDNTVGVESDDASYEDSNSKDQESSLASGSLTADSDSSSSLTVSSAGNSPSLTSDGSGTNDNPVSKTNTTLKVSSSSVYSGNPVIVTLKDKDGKVLSGKKVTFNVTTLKKVYTRTTNSKGQANITLNNVKTYKVIISFAGDSNYNSSKYSGSVTVKKARTSLTVPSTSVPRSTALVVTLKNKANNQPISGKKIKFIVPQWNNKVYTKTTDKNGQAKLTINAERKFGLIVNFTGDSNLYNNKTKIKIKPVKCGSKLSFDKVVGYGDNFVVTLSNKVSNASLKNKKVVVNITSLKKVYKRTTNSKGQVKIPIYHLGTLNVVVKFAGNDVYIKSSAKGKITVEKGKTTLSAANNVGQGNKYVITLKNGAGVGLANKKVSFSINGKTYNKTTNSKGQISFTFNYKVGKYPINISYGGNKNYNSSKVSKTITLTKHQLSMSSIIAAAKKLKVKVYANDELDKSYTVTIEGKKYTLDEFAYLMARTLTNLKKGSSATILPKDLSNNYNSTGKKINGKLSKKQYLKLASEVTSFVDSKNRIPNYKSTSLGKMEADLYIYSFISALDSYSKHKKLPKSVSVKTSYIDGGYSISASQWAKLLNSKEAFNKAEFAKYLKAGGKSALTKAIKKKAKEITAGLTSPMAKANAIFKFVRDDITYSFYANSLKGASKTLSSKKGNCCDKANLIVAMCRSVGVHARYSHAQGCRFRSGLYTGHVWAQVYDTSSHTWYSADATSYRNQLGNIKNWNTKSYHRAHNYAQIPF